MCHLCTIIDDHVIKPYKTAPKTKNMETTMRYNTSTSATDLSIVVNPPANTQNKSETQTQREYLGERLKQMNAKWAYYETKRTALEDKFHLNDARSLLPKTVKEAKERIAAGKFTLHGIYGSEKEDSKNFFENFSWADPATPPDYPGFELALEEVRKAYQDTLDIIRLKPIDEAFDALKAFENFEPTTQYDPKRKTAETLH